MAIRVTELDTTLLDGAVILGPPGIGKSEVLREKARQEAASKGRVFVDIHEALRQGYKLNEIREMVSNDPSRYYLYYEVSLPLLTLEYFLGGSRDALEALKLFTLKSVEGMLVIDGITVETGNEGLALVARLVGEKRLDPDIVLSETVRCVALGYTREYGGPQSLPLHLSSRVMLLEAAPPTLEEWYWYMLEKYSGMMPEHYAFILSRVRRAIESASDELGVSIFLAPPEYASDGLPTPRSWTRLVLTLTRLYERLRAGDISLDEYRRLASEAIRGALGSRVASTVEKHLDGGAITSDALLELYRRGRDGFRELLQEAFGEESELRDDIIEAIRGLDTLYAYRVLKATREALDAITAYALGDVDHEQASRSLERFIRETSSLLRELRGLLEFILSSLTPETSARDAIEVLFEVDDRLRDTMLKLAERVEMMVRDARRRIEASREAGRERRQEALRLVDALWDAFNRVLTAPYPSLRSMAGMGV